jgi:hypothetical protein
MTPIPRIFRHWSAKCLKVLRSDSFWTKIERLTRVVVLLGIPLFFIEQHLKREEERASNTLDFVKRFQDAQLVGQRFSLLKSWMQYDVKAIEVAHAPREVLDELVLKMIEVSAETAGAEDLRPAIFGIVDFYESLSVCIEIRRCDRNIATNYFSDYARRFYCLYEPYIKRLRDQQSIADYGARLERFALQKGSCSG